MWLFYRTQEVLEINDCFYRNMYNYEYIAIFDVDEYIIPVNFYNWSQLIDEFKVNLEYFIYF